MAMAKKKKPELSNMVPVRVSRDSATLEYTFDRISDSVSIAQSADNHHAHPAAAQKDAELTRNWESLPLYEHGDHAPKKELFKFFKKTINLLF